MTDNTPHTPFADYYESLDAAIIAYVNGNEVPFNEHVERFNLHSRVPNDPLAKRCAVMKMATSRNFLPLEVRTAAKRWLAENGFQSWDDGELTETDR